MRKKSSSKRSKPARHGTQVARGRHCNRGLQSVVLRSLAPHLPRPYPQPGNGNEFGVGDHSYISSPVRSALSRRLSSSDDLFSAAKLDHGLQTDALEGRMESAKRGLRVTGAQDRHFRRHRCPYFRIPHAATMLVHNKCYNNTCKDKRAGNRLRRKTQVCKLQNAAGKCGIPRCMHK